MLKHNVLDKIISVNQNHVEMYFSDFQKVTCLDLLLVYSTSIITMVKNVLPQLNEFGSQKSFTHMRTCHWHTEDTH